MKFTQSFIVAVLAAAANAQMSAQQVVSNIDQITQLSSQTNDIAKSISVVNFFSTTPVKAFPDVLVFF
jgi:hypothetical protein